MKGTSSIPPKLNKEMNEDVFYASCVLFDQYSHICGGRITRDHAVEFGGRQVQAKWAIIPVCAQGHGVDDFQDKGDTSKELREWVAFSRATEEDICKLTGESVNVVPNSLSKSWPLIKRKRYLEGKYGVYTQKVPDPKRLAEMAQTRPLASPIQPKWHALTGEETDILEFGRQFYEHVLDQPMDLHAMVNRMLKEQEKVIKMILSNPGTASQGDTALFERIKSFKPEKK